MPEYEVEVRTVNIEYYEVVAKDEAEAKERALALDPTWDTTAVETLEREAISVVDIFEDDGVEYEDDFEDDEEDG